jgi:hypothetical protein
MDGDDATGCGISRYDDVAASEENWAEVLESGSDRLWWVWHDVEGAPALFYE